MQTDHRELLAVHDWLSTTSKWMSSAWAELRTKRSRRFEEISFIGRVDAGSCNGCELEVVALNNPVYDIERFGIHFVASPRHADMLLVTGPAARNMELALLQTYRQCQNRSWCRRRRGAALAAEFRVELRVVRWR